MLERAQSVATRLKAALSPRKAKLSQVVIDQRAYSDLYNIHVAFLRGRFEEDRYMGEIPGALDPMLVRSNGWLRVYCFMFCVSDGTRSETIVFSSNAILPHDVRVTFIDGRLVSIVSGFEVRTSFDEVEIRSYTLMLADIRGWQR